MQEIRRPNIDAILGRTPKKEPATPAPDASAPEEMQEPAKCPPGRLTLDPLGVMEASPAPSVYQLSVMRWLALPGREDLREGFEPLAASGRAQLVEISAQSLRSLVDDGRILFREAQLSRQVLFGIKLPLLPGYLNAQQEECDGPVIIVRTERDFAVPNGNHRLYTVAHQAGTAHPLYALFFDCPESHGIFMSDEPVDFSRRSYRVPALVSGPRRGRSRE